MFSSPIPKPYIVHLTDAKQARLQSMQQTVAEQGLFSAARVKCEMVCLRTRCELSRREHMQLGTCNGMEAHTCIHTITNAHTHHTRVCVSPGSDECAAARFNDVFSPANSSWKCCEFCSQRPRAAGWCCGTVLLARGRALVLQNVSMVAAALRVPARSCCVPL